MEDSWIWLSPFAFSLLWYTCYGASRKFQWTLRREWNWKSKNILLMTAVLISVPWKSFRSPRDHAPHWEPALWIVFLPDLGDSAESLSQSPGKALQEFLHFVCFLFSAHLPAATSRLFSCLPLSHLLSSLQLSVYKMYFLLKIRGFFTFLKLFGHFRLQWCK